MMYTCVAGGDECSTWQIYFGLVEERVPGCDAGTKQMAASTVKPGCRGYRIIREDNAPRNAWSLAIVEQAKPDAQDLERV